MIGGEDPDHGKTVCGDKIVFGETERKSTDESKGTLWVGGKNAKL